MQPVEDFLPKCTLCEDLKNYRYINHSLKKFDKGCSDCAYVSAEGLEANPDNLHFNAALNEFGIRYFNEYEKLGSFEQNLSHKAVVNENFRTKMELLQNSVCKVGMGKHNGWCYCVTIAVDI